MLNYVDLVLFLMVFSLLLVFSIVFNIPRGGKNEDGIETVEERRRKIEAEYDLYSGGEHFFF